MSLFDKKAEELNELAKLIGGQSVDGEFISKGEYGSFKFYVDDEYAGSATIHILEGDKLIWSGMQLNEATQKQGVMTRMAKYLPTFMLDNGVTTSIVPAPSTDAIRHALRGQGYVPSDQGFWSAEMKDLKDYGDSL